MNLVTNTVIIQDKFIDNNITKRIKIRDEREDPRKTPDLHKKKRLRGTCRMVKGFVHQSIFYINDLMKDNFRDLNKTSLTRG